MSFKLKSQFKPTGDQPQAIKKLVSGLKKKQDCQTLLGVTGSGKTFTMANIIEKVQKPTLVISHNKTLAAQLTSEFKDFFPNNEVHYFVSFYDYYQPEAYIPRTDTYIEKDTDINDEIDRLRHAATEAILSNPNVIIVASVSCIYGLGSPARYREVSLELKIKQEYQRKAVLQKLTEMQYQRNNVVLQRGTFAVKGETIEIFPALADKFYYRLQFFGDQLEKIYKVNLLTNDILEEYKELVVFPATHYILDPDNREIAFEQIQTDLKKRLAEFKRQDKLLEHQRLKERIKHDMEMIEQTGYVSGIENYSRYFDGRNPGEPPYTLIDFFPKDFLLFIDESHITVPQIRGMYAGDKARKQNLVDFGWRLPAALDNRPLKYEEFLQKTNQTVYVSATPNEENIKKSKQIVEQFIRPTGLLDPDIQVRPTKNQIPDLISNIESRVVKGQRTLVTVLTKRLAEEFPEYLKEKNIAVQYLHSEVDTLERLEILRDLRKGVYDVLVGINLLREGLDLPEVSLVAILDADKESFLRDERSLMQIMGRAARHKQGQVIMYADTVTKSMKAAVVETNRRRKIQEDYNQKHNIKPRTIKKKIKADRLSGAKLKKEQQLPADAIAKLPKSEIKYIIKELENQMSIASQNLEFEKAAAIRDQIKELKKI